MALLRKCIMDREQREPGWYERLFNWSPWLTNFLLALVRLIVLLLLVLSIGPCIINQLVAFIKEQVNTVQLMVLRTHYQPLDPLTGVSRMDP